MVQIKPSQQQVENARTPHAYIEAHTQGAFGEQVAHAYASLGKSMQDAQFAVQRYNDSVNRTKALELKNSFYTEWEQPKLYSKEGYYNQLGANASGRSQELIKDFDNFARKKAKELGLTGFGSEKYVELVIADTKEKISRGVLAHDLKQTQEAEKTQAGLLIQNLQTSAINNRNNDFELEKNLADISKAAYMFGVSSNMDNAQIEAMTINQKSDTVSKVIASCLNENSLKAKTIFEKYKQYLTPEAQIQLSDKIHGLEVNLTSRDIADKYYMSGLNHQQAFENAYKIQDVELRDATISKVDFIYNQREHLKNEQYNKLKEDAWEKVYQTKNPDDIPYDMKAEDKNAMLKFCRQGGGVEDSEVYVSLKEMSIQNAEQFASLDLTLYRPYLTDSQYTDFVQKKKNITTHGYSVISRDDARIIQAADSLGLRKTVNNRDALADVTQALINAEERRYGESFTPQRQNVYFKLVDYGSQKDKNSNFRLLQEYGDRANFYKDVTNEIQYHIKKGHDPYSNPELFNQILNSVVKKYKNKQNEAVLNSTVNVGDIWHGHRITSLYGKRTSPTSGATTDHKGIDLAYENNEPFGAVASGTVVDKGYDKKLGNYVKIKSADGAIFIYGHANNILVNKNDTVRYEQVIGHAGSTGISTGPHVHLAKIVNGQYVNPLGDINSNPEKLVNNNDPLGVR